MIDASMKLCRIHDQDPINAVFPYFFVCPAHAVFCFNECLIARASTSLANGLKHLVDLSKGPLAPFRDVTTHTEALGDENASRSDSGGTNDDLKRQAEQLSRSSNVMKRMVFLTLHCWWNFGR